MLIRGTQIPYCSLHYGDPSLTSQCSWKHCSNARFGCKFLSDNRKGVKCFACNSNSFPCRNALLGCSNHVRSSANVNPRDRPACSAHASMRCPFDSRVADRCSSLYCGNTHISLDDSRCSSCVEGNTPCINACSRHASPNSNGYCAFCGQVQALRRSAHIASSALKDDQTSPQLDSTAFSIGNSAALSQASTAAPAPWVRVPSGHAPGVCLLVCDLCVHVLCEFSFLPLLLLLLCALCMLMK